MNGAGEVIAVTLGFNDGRLDVITVTNKPYQRRLIQEAKPAWRGTRPSRAPVPLNCWRLGGSRGLIAIPPKGRKARCADTVAAWFPRTGWWID